MEGCTLHAWPLLLPCPSQLFHLCLRPGPGCDAQQNCSMDVEETPREQKLKILTTYINILWCRWCQEIVEFYQGMGTGTSLWHCICRSKLPRLVTILVAAVVVTVTSHRWYHSGLPLSPVCLPITLVLVACHCCCHCRLGKWRACWGSLIGHWRDSCRNSSGLSWATGSCWRDWGLGGAGPCNSNKGQALWLFDLNPVKREIIMKTRAFSSFDVVSVVSSFCSASLLETTMEASRLNLLSCW